MDRTLRVLGIHERHVDVLSLPRQPRQCVSRGTRTASQDQLYVWNPTKHVFCNPSDQAGAPVLILGVVIQSNHDALRTCQGKRCSADPECDTDREHDPRLARPRDAAKNVHL